jgi:predicted lipid-binding transport protein (Tim44 family)
MKIRYRVIGVAVVAIGLVLTSGCENPNGTQNNTGTGALAGGLAGALAGGVSGGRHAGEHALFGALAGALVGGLIGNMIDHEQQQKLRQQSPQTLQTIRHNDAVYQQQQQAAHAQASGQAPQAQTPGQAPQPQTQPPPADALIPLTVDDIKALDSAGVKKEVIIAEIGRSKSVFTQADITALQQSNPNIDPAIINCMKSHPS